MFLVVSFWVSKWTWFLDLSCFIGNTLNNSAKDLEHIKEKADSLEDDRNHWRKQAESVTLLLETDRKKPGIFDLFSKK
jgi:hypothetical protein